jgi:hypothetical protein
MSEQTRELIRKAAVINAIKHDGRAELQAVLGNLLGDAPELRSQAKNLIPLVREVIDEVNSTSIEKLRDLALQNWPAELSREKKEEERELPPLPNVEKYKTIITRIAPNPDFVLHLGNARAAVLSHDYARMYKGKFIVRFEDTDPRLKKRIQQLKEVNPMLGHRGVRLGVTNPEIYQMQINAILEARAEVSADVSIMVPQVITLQELLWVKGYVKDPTLKVGVMMETVRACLRAGKLA